MSKSNPPNWRYSRYAIALLLAGMLAIVPAETAVAQSPTPWATFHDYAPSNINLNNLAAIWRGSVWELAPTPWHLSNRQP